MRIGRTRGISLAYSADNYTLVKLMFSKHFPCLSDPIQQTNTTRWILEILRFIEEWQYSIQLASIELCIAYDGFFFTYRHYVHGKKKNYCVKSKLVPEAASEWLDNEGRLILRFLQHRNHFIHSANISNIEKAFNALPIFAKSRTKRRKKRPRVNDRVITRSINHYSNHNEAVNHTIVQKCIR